MCVKIVRSLRVAERLERRNINERSSVLRRMVKKSIF